MKKDEATIPSGQPPAVVYLLQPKEPPAVLTATKGLTWGTIQAQAPTTVQQHSNLGTKPRSTVARPFLKNWRLQRLRNI